MCSPFPSSLLQPFWPPCCSWLHATGILWPQGLGIQPEILLPRHPNASPPPSAGKFNHLKLRHWITHSPSSLPCFTFASTMHANSLQAIGFNYYACYLSSSIRMYAPQRQRFWSVLLIALTSSFRIGSGIPWAFYKYSLNGSMKQTKVTNSLCNVF